MRLALIRSSISWLAVAAALLALPGAAVGQTGGVRGQVRDAATGEPINGATAALLAAADSSAVQTVLTNADGRVLFIGVPAGSYYVEVSHLAYGEVVTDEISVEAGETLDLGVLGLDIEALELDAIEVTTERPAVVYEADRTSYDVAQMSAAEGAAASDVLRLMPELEVDIDGQVTMRGARTAIYIDGRPAPMDGVSLSVFLEQFPSDNIERIEIIDNPSARYSAEGTGGIVNIVLKEGVELGMSGNAFLNGGTRGQMGVGARATLQRGPWTFNANTFLNRTDRETTGFDLRQNLLVDPTTFLQQDSYSDRDGRSARVDLEVRYEPSERSRVWVEGRFDGRGDGSNGLTTTTHMDAARDPTSRYERASDSDQDNLSGGVATGFSYEWERRRHELEIELELDTERNDEDTHEEIGEYDEFGDVDQAPPELTLEEEEERDLEAAANVDYVRPWGEEGRVELGYQAELEDTDSDRLLQLFTAPGVADEESRLGFSHTRVFNSLYLTLQRQIGSVGVQVGLRGERADTRFEVPGGGVFNNDYYSLFPSANLSYRLDGDRQLRISYSRRIARPSSSVLNPINRSTDPLNRRVGNPDIEPAYTHSVSLNASWGGSLGRLRFSPFYRLTENDWAEITTIDTDGVATQSYDNLASQESYGATLTASMQRGQRINGFVSVSGRREIRDASNLSERYSGSFTRWSTRLNLEAVVTEQLSAQGTFSYTPPVDRPQGRTSSRLASDFGIRYRFMDRRASLRLSFEDPFGLSHSSSESRDPSYVQIGRSEESSRSVTFNLSYAFGGGGSRRGGGRGR